MATYPVAEGEKIDADVGLYLINKNQDDCSFPMNFQFGGHEFVCLKGVFMPEGAGHHCFIEHIPVNQNGTSVLEIGSGTGVIICGLYLKHPGLISNILATDINPQAVLNTKMNFEKHNIPGRTLTGDLFDCVPNNEKFDLIFWNMPFHLVPEEKELSIVEKAIADPGYKTIERFLFTSGNFLSTNGKCILGFSTDFGDFELLCRLAKKHNKQLDVSWSDYIDCPPLGRKVVYQLIEVKDSQEVAT